MRSILRNIFAVILGWIGGSVVNMLLVEAGHSIFPIEGVNLENMDTLAKALPEMGAKYFIFPFLAHALGTLVGAFLASKIASTHKFQLAMAVGILFLLGGIAVNYMIGGPLWFIVLDIALAYIPMAWIGSKLAK